MLLEHHPELALQVFVIWEPMITTDWTTPSNRTLGRIADSRVRQFWDPKHLVSGELTRFAQAKPLQFHPDCCHDDGFYWDMAIVYPPGASWQEVPDYRFANGPVYRIIPALESALRAEPGPSAGR
jgi:hypothetical protein